jgi:hypothetical protein
MAFRDARRGLLEQLDELGRRVPQAPHPVAPRQYVMMRTARGEGAPVDEPPAFDLAERCRTRIVYRTGDCRADRDDEPRPWVPSGSVRHRGIVPRRRWEAEAESWVESPPRWHTQLGNFSSVFTMLLDIATVSY